MTDFYASTSTAYASQPVFLIRRAERLPVPAGLDLNESRQPQIVAITIIAWFIAVLSVILRIVSRRIKRARLWLDDWIIVAAVPFSTALSFSVAGYGVSKGLGKHIWATPPDSMYAWAIVMLIGLVTYPVVVVCFKWSILAFYWRLFRFERSVRIFIWILVALVFLWGLAVFDPVNPLTPGSYNCRISQMKFLRWNAIPTLVTDVVLLILPLPYIWGLQLPRAKKIGIVATFLLGSFILIVTIIRLSFLVRGQASGYDMTWNMTEVILWVIAEANVGIVCACLPLLLPVLTKLRRETKVNEIRAGNKGYTRTVTPHEEEGMSYPLERVVPDDQNFAEVRVSSGGDKAPEDNSHAHYGGEYGSEMSLRRSDEEESAEEPSLDHRCGLGGNGILVTTEISVHK
ncbi:hypothetical protein ED733_002409 [Metarhizium rileyi]|uniref:Rhodopsin domain-containing protein n=1 Tax=Metarhizium rileyi (strain RCEF 4871) TaxID=1649241 RepID=A0A5C6G224_METRR|nr:hypothetical protein ED733_002409 [Metarhizium rileyi]